jgi:hypothetical protein
MENRHRKNELNFENENQPLGKKAILQGLPTPKGPTLTLLDWTAQGL